MADKGQLTLIADGGATVATTDTTDTTTDTTTATADSDDLAAKGSADAIAAVIKAAMGDGGKVRPEVLTAVLRGAGLLDEGDDEDGFWQPENRAVVVPETQAIAIYINPDGQVVIRTGNARREDHFVWFDRHHLPAVIARLQTIGRDAGGAR